jgi:hypothetical protein
MTSRIVRASFFVGMMTEILEGVSIAYCENICVRPGELRNKAAILTIRGAKTHFEAFPLLYGYRSSAFLRVANLTEHNS